MLLLQEKKHVFLGTHYFGKNGGCWETQHDHLCYSGKVYYIYSGLSLVSYMLLGQVKQIGFTWDKNRGK